VTAGLPITVGRPGPLATIPGCGGPEYDCRWLWEGSPRIYGDECLDLCDGDRVKYIILKIKEILFLKKFIYIHWTL